MYRGNEVEGFRGSGAEYGQFEQSRQMQQQGGSDRRDIVMMQQPQHRFAQNQYRQETSSPNLNLPHASRQIPQHQQQHNSHAQAQQRLQSHASAHQPVSYHTSNGQTIPPSHNLPSHSQSLSQSPHLVQQRQKVVAQQPHPSQFQQHQIRYNPSPEQQREHPLPSPQIPSSTPNQFSSAPSPYAASPSTYAPSPNQPTQHQRQSILPHPAARRMSVEQSIAANLPPSNNSPRTNRQPAYPTPSQSIPSNRFPSQQNSLQYQSTSRMPEETPVAGPSNSRQQPQMTTRFVEFEPPSTVSQSQQPNPIIPPQALPETIESKSSTDDKTTTIFHSYVLDYLQRAGFLSTAAAFLSENPSISLHSADSGRVFPSNSSKNASSSIRSYTTSPTSISNPSSRTSPTSLPLFRSESGSSPISPTQQDAQNHSTVESTSSTSSSSTFGFERTKGNGTDDEFPSPGDEKREETKANRQRTIPAANVEYEVESGYLYEWFHVFYDVHSARSGKGGSVQARSLVQANSSVQTVASRTQISPVRRVPGQQQQHPRPPITIDTAQTQARPSLGSRRMSGMGNMQQTSEVPGRTVVNRATPFQQPASVSHSQPPPLSRRNSQQLYVQQQQESQARQQTLQERQRLQQVQIEQIQMQKQMMDKLQQEAQQITARQKSLSASSQPPTPVASGLPGRSNESFSTYHASLSASQRSQLEQASPTLSNAETSPGSFVSGRRQSSNGTPMVKIEDQPRPTMSRTYSQPHVQQLAASPLDGLMPPPSSTSAPHSRPPLSRSASTSFVQEDQNTPKLSELTGNSSKRRRDSVIELPDQSETRELKKVRSSSEVGGVSKITSTKSPLSFETDFTASSPTASTVEVPIVPSQAKTPVERLSNPSSESQSKQDFAPMNDTEAFLASLNASNDVAGEASMGGATSDELEVPTMTDAELDAFFAASMNEIDQTPHEPYTKGPPVSIPDTADFDFTEYNSFFGADSASYDPTTFDLNV